MDRDAFAGAVVGVVAFILLFLCVSWFFGGTDENPSYWAWARTDRAAAIAENKLRKAQAEKKMKDEKLAKAADAPGFDLADFGVKSD